MYTILYAIPKFFTIEHILVISIILLPFVFQVIICGYAS